MEFPINRTGGMRSFWIYNTIDWMTPESESERGDGFQQPPSTTDITSFQIAPFARCLADDLDAMVRVTAP